MKTHTKLFALSLFVAVLAICGAMLMTGCGHHHTGHVPERIDPTCTEDGVDISRCEECGEIRHETILPALGHKYSEYVGGSEVFYDYCVRCGEPNPDSSSFVPSDSYGTAQPTEDGVLSWGRLKEAVKYEISVTYSGGDKQLFEMDKTKGSVKLDELSDEPFPVGKTAVTFTPYAVHKETVDGEAIEQEYPMTEISDEFQVIKLNGKFSVTRLKYADENVTLNGFYSDVREDENGNSYYLLEQLLTGNKATQFNISRKVTVASGLSAKYYRSAEDRQNNSNALSSMDLQFQYINAGYNTYYMQVTGNGVTQDYDLKVYGLMKLTVNMFNVTSTTVDGYRKDSYTQIGSDMIYTEGDIIPKEALFANCQYSSKSARDASYNFIKYEDYVVTAPQSGDRVNIYFSETTLGDCNTVAEYKRYFSLTETENGWMLTNMYSQSQSKDIFIPEKIMNKRILAAQFYYSDIEYLHISAPNISLSFTECSSLIKVILQPSVKSMQSGAFAGANDGLVIECYFDEEYANTNFDSNWNSKNATSIWSGKFTTIYH